MDSYAAFLETMEQGETEKQKALASCDLSLMDQTIAAQQAALMQLESFERQRRQLMLDAGLGEKTFREILDGLTGEEKKRFEVLFRRFERAVSNIRHLNDKSMEIARADLQVIRGVSPDDGQKSYAPGKGNAAPNALPSLFETKI